MAHDLIFFEKRSTPLVVSKGAAPSSNSNYTEKYGKQTSRRAATAEEEKKIAKGDWVQVDSKGHKSGEDGYKKTQYRPGLVKSAEQAAETPAGANAPYKIVKRGSQYAVVNNAGLTKATFPTRAKALAYQRALYANVPGASKRGTNVKWSGKARDRVPATPSKVGTQSAGLIEGDDLRPDDLASATDAALDAAAMQIMANTDDIASLPGWVQQVISLTLAAGATVDTLLVAMHIDDPDDEATSAEQAAAEGIESYLQSAADLGNQQQGGGFPIPDVAHLRKAIQAFGRSSDKPKTKAHIKSRAKALGRTDLIPDGWN
jgi:hypothetical protein